MYCPTCGVQNPDDAGFCSGCGKPLPKTSGGQATGPTTATAPGGEQAPNMVWYIVGAAAATLLCCPPIGIAALVCAILINSKAVAGDLAGARKIARVSMILSIVAAAVGVIGWIIFLVFMGGLATLGSMTQNPYGV